jgi:hypothetical protein
MSVTIVSLYPRELRAERQYSPVKGQKLHIYVLPAAADGKPSELTIEHAYEKVYQGESLGHRWSLVEEGEVAKCLLLAFSSGRIGQDTGLGPGIFIKDPERYEEQLEEARLKQEAYFGYLFDQANAAHRTGHIDDITGEMRDAARWLGKEPTWLVSPKQEVKKECPLCASQIPVQVVVCPVCRRQIGKIPKEIAALGKGQPVPAA